MRFQGVLLRWAAGLVLAALGVLALSAVAFAETKSFTKAGCSKWEVPFGVGSLSVAAVGGAGGNAAPGSAGGNGDEVAATVKVAAGKVLYVCVDQGGGKGGSDQQYGEGGFGGGASGVALGADFSAPVLVAGGGGGGGVNTEGFGGPAHAGDSGGPAATQGGGPSGGKVEGGSKFNSEGPGRGGTGENGLVVQLEPPHGGIAGAGGGGGGGYVGGGGGGKGTETDGGSGGAGGTDLCENSEAVSSCTTNKEAGTGTGSVTITYTLPASAFPLFAPESARPSGSIPYATKTVTLETVSKHKISCLSREGSFQVESEYTLRLSLYMYSCTSQRQPCYTSAQPQGQMSLQFLGQLVSLSREKHTVAVLFSPYNGAAEGRYEEFQVTCRNIATYYISGQVLAPISPVNKIIYPPATFSLKFAQKAGVQNPGLYQGSGPITLTTSLTPPSEEGVEAPVQTGFAFSSPLTFSEPLEIDG